MWYNDYYYIYKHGYFDRQADVSQWNRFDTLPFDIGFSSFVIISPKLFDTKNIEKSRNSPVKLLQINHLS